jgi:hypothetical protein
LAEALEIRLNQTRTYLDLEGCQVIDGSITLD